VLQRHHLGAGSTVQAQAGAPRLGTRASAGLLGAWKGRGRCWCLLLPSSRLIAEPPRPLIASGRGSLHVVGRASVLHASLLHASAALPRAAVTNPGSPICARRPGPWHWKPFRRAWVHASRPRSPHLSTARHAPRHHTRRRHLSSAVRAQWTPIRDEPRRLFRPRPRCRPRDSTRASRAVATSRASFRSPSRLTARGLRAPRSPRAVPIH
jgi:hypothetical protein